MDSFSGSTPRRFISFYLEQETNGQLTQKLAEVEETDRNEFSIPNIAQDFPTGSQQSSSETKDSEVRQLQAPDPAHSNSRVTAEGQDIELCPPQTSELTKKDQPTTEAMDTECNQPQTSFNFIEFSRHLIGNFLAYQPRSLNCDFTVFPAVGIK